MKIVVVADNTSFEKPINSSESYIESSYKLFLTLGQEVYVQCPVNVAKEVGKFVPKKMIWTEPVKRGTAPALGLAAVYASAKKSEELALFAFANQTVLYRDKLLNTLKIAESLYKQLRKIILIGVAITEETDKYGYIEVGRVDKEMSGILAFEMKSFRRHIKQEELRAITKTWKYLWDTGYVISKPTELLLTYQKSLPSVYSGLIKIKETLNTRDEYEVLKNIYGTFPKVSFSEGVIEKVDYSNLAVIQVDLGVIKLFER